MWLKIEKILASFSSCFSRKSAYKWFAAVIIGIMVRTDKLGLTSIIRDLSLKTKSYDAMIKFFRAASWDLQKIYGCWHEAVLRHAPILRIRDRAVIIGDGTKQPKEGRRMPGVKKMAQESETQGKPQMIFGHMWGCVGILAGNWKNPVSIPLSMRIHDGLRETAGWEGSGRPACSHVVQMIRDGCRAAARFGSAYYLMDRYFLSVPALKELARWNDGSPHRVDLVVKAKISAAAYLDPEKRRPGQKGPNRKKGDKVKLSELFDSCSGKFTEAEAMLYGKKRTIRYLAKDLLWGQGLYRKLRFVLVEYDSVRSILVTTDLYMSPIEVIEAYGKRFRIETSFRTLKQDIGGMSYRFWTKFMPKLNHYRKKEDPDPLSCVPAENREHILKTVRATEMYAAMSCISMGILQILAVFFPEDKINSVLRYQRAKAENRPSEANIMHFLRRHLFGFMEKHADHAIPRLIRSVQEADYDLDCELKECFQ